MGLYRLTQAADWDIEEILDYGIDHHGINAALDYYATLETHFSRLAEQPTLYTGVDDIRKGYRRSVCGVHSIYYRIEGQDVVIVRVLRAQDVRNAF